MGDRKPQAANCKGATDATEYARYAANLEPLKEVPKYPEWLLSEARCAWRRVAQHLVDRGILTSIDLASFGLCCQSYGRWRIAKREMEVCGADAQNALARIAKMERGFFEALCKDFGLSPTDFFQIAEGDEASGMSHAASDKIITGELHGSIRTGNVKGGARGKRITVGIHHKDNAAYFANPLEFGHGGPAPAPAHPFVRPAFDVRSDEAYEEIKRVLRDELNN